ncbi:MAG TPA: T9SS type A sorting domain-containing protein [Candidatus Marinimicrobia bacterium]|nr:T9SS type A sorting domain-containing protein [Candidatus Neomarinimicrobiota bacterium]HRS52495.1 T9SS type A sorting domain-containing protein [Candidatus Neomarinimicrobiota bacterium]HRU93108.1 T9SS type A sorting domain-containing protein [Candidatus Neomarinimicrobiota bacterium]
MKSRFAVLTILLIFKIGLADDFTFILCEGNFNSTNASLWQLTGTNELIGPVHWNFDDKPLGDVAQNLKIYRNKLFIVVNNSNSLEVMSLANGVTYERTISLPSAGPRDIAFVNDHAYITCWYLPGILSLDLNTWQIDDTIAINGLPDNIIADKGKLYTSIAMNSDWSSADKVLVLEYVSGEFVPSDTFTVISGPNQLLLHENRLYVLSTYYDDAWNTYTGTSCINLETNQVIKRDQGSSFNFCDDIALINDKIYRSYNGGVAPLTDSLTIDTNKIIGNFSGIYSMAFDGKYIFIGLSDYSAPDQVIILDTLGNEINTLNVGVCPGSFAFYKQPNAEIFSGENSAIQSDFLLMANYPNPFNSNTIIPFYLKHKNLVQLTIYNLKGELIAKLTNDYFASGYHSVIWDGRDQCGRLSPAGIYFVEIRIQGQIQTHKMLFIK